ncbi:MAG TPA: hypothetical protein VK716_06105 [Terracidiphilus sp.]|jgi:hypothetical protein|nr:hypothetical protein [Terracidiphilus sp.]
MLTLSAPDAIGPAIERTKHLLFRPFRWGTFLKLCLVAVVTEGFSSNFSSGSHSSSHSTSTTTSSLLPFDISPVVIAAGVAAILLVLIISLALFYLITRLRFALFECLVQQSTLIRPGWHRYREQASRFFWLNVWVGVVFLVIVALIAMPFAAGFLQLVRSSTPGHFDLGLLLSLLLPLIPIIFLIILVALATDLILRDFMLPHFALENATAGQAWAAVRTRISAEKGAFFLYAILRIFLPIVAMIGIFIALIIPSLIVIGIAAGIVAGLHAALSGAAGTATTIVVGILVGCLVAAYFIFAILCFGGPLGLTIRNYSLVFYGGRYPVLGNTLYPPAPQATFGATP